MNAAQHKLPVMVGLGPTIQGYKQESLFASLSARRLDGRIKCGHDGEGW